MLKPHALVLFALFTLRSLCGAIEWKPWMELGNDVFPSLLISTATVNWNGDPEEESDDEEVAPTLGDLNGWFGVSLTDVPTGAKISVEISADGWAKPSNVTVTVKKAADTVYVQPKMLLDYDMLRQVRQGKPTNMTFKVKVNGMDLGERTETLILHEINDCPFYVNRGKEEDALDLTWMFAAYVNENHPWIDGLLKEALETGIVDSFTGYQSEDKKTVLSQVFAIWHVLQRRGIKYSDITTTPGSKMVSSQTVRLLDDTVEATQANCVDGSVLMASILRKIGLNVSLVLVPGHCYLAFDTDAAGEDTVGLETTMLGNDNLKPLAESVKLSGKTQEKEFKASQKTFLHALNVGTQNMKKNADKFEDDDESDYQIIPIQEARDFGIMPLASEKSRK